MVINFPRRVQSWIKANAILLALDTLRTFVSCPNPTDLILFLLLTGDHHTLGGSDDNFSVYLTALKPLEDIEIASAGGNSGSSSTDSGGSSTVTDGGQTVVVTSPGEANPVESEDDGPNTGAIAAGVVVGVAALAAIIGGGWFFMRRRNRKAMENEHHRTATIDHFVAGGKPNSSSSMSDSRLDPSMMAHRRQSDGSIADNQDFSRRILQVLHSPSLPCVPTQIRHDC